MLTYSQLNINGWATNSGDVADNSQSFSKNGIIIKVEEFKPTDFGFPEANAEKRMVKLDGTSAGGWFLVYGKAENNKEYTFTIDCIAKYYNKDLLAVFYEDTEHHLKRLENIKVKEDAKSNKYTIEFDLSANDCYLNNGKANLFFGFNLDFSLWTTVATNQIYIYEPILREKGVTTGNLVKDPYFSNSFAFVSSMAKSLNTRSWGTAGESNWESFELMKHNAYIFNTKKTTTQMAKLVSPEQSFRFIQEVRVKPGQELKFGLDFFTELDVDMESIISFLYDTYIAGFGRSKEEIFEKTFSEEKTIKRYYYTFKVPSKEELEEYDATFAEDGTINLNIQLQAITRKNVYYVANYSLVDVNDKLGKNLLVNSDFTSGFFGYKYYEANAVQAWGGISFSEYFLSWYSQVMDYDSLLFKKTQSEIIMGTSWALEFGPIREKDYGDLDEDDYDDSDIYDFEETERDGEPEDTPTNTKPKQQTYRKKKVVVVDNGYDYTWWIIGGVSGLVVLAGTTVYTIYAVKKRKIKKG